MMNKMHHRLQSDEILMRLVCGTCRIVTDTRVPLLFYDNWFLSLDLSQTLNEQGILTLATVRVNRLKSCALELDYKMESVDLDDMLIELYRINFKSRKK
ncbi:hypothetical protein QYM36_011854 [Artemia franciscana]|uniref:PiggyBac transposable element-derived protein domain-containing protein n=1 Tax=Artemia franciscana TaxID=6661 RepID=A0AA88HHM5_ARTSF|nr:hypothetical protein QYM36_011854 [Artemia franciscana]